MKLLQHIQDGGWIDDELQFSDEVKDASTFIVEIHVVATSWRGGWHNPVACTCAWGETCNGNMAWPPLLEADEAVVHGLSVLAPVP